MADSRNSWASRAPIWTSRGKLARVARPFGKVDHACRVASNSQPHKPAPFGLHRKLNSDRTHNISVRSRAPHPLGHLSNSHADAHTKRASNTCEQQGNNRNHEQQTKLFAAKFCSSRGLTSFVGKLAWLCIFDMYSLSGLMDKASGSEPEDCGFKSHLGQHMISSVLPVICAGQHQPRRFAP